MYTYIYIYTECGWYDLDLSFLKSSCFRAHRWMHQGFSCQMSDGSCQVFGCREVWFPLGLCMKPSGQ